MLETDGVVVERKLIHDVRNQLSSILGINELLLVKLPLNSDLRIYSERVIDIVKKTNGLLQDYERIRNRH